MYCWIFLVTLGLGACLVQAQSACRFVRIEGTAHRHEASGRFKVDTTEQCLEKFSYKQVNGPFHLYYGQEANSSANGSYAWIVGTDLCDPVVSIQCFDDGAPYPEHITETCDEVSSETGNWTVSPTVTISCDPGFDSDCNEVKLDVYSNSRGTYKRQPVSEMCFGKYTYKKPFLDYDYYIYSAFGSWFVSKENCDIEEPYYDLYRFPDGAFYPEQITSKGQVWSSVQGVWRSSSVSIECERASAGCNAVQIEGTRRQHQTIGRYDVLPRDNTCSRRRVYQQKNGIYYLFYLDSIDVWAIGLFACNASVNIHVYDTSTNPEDIEEDFREYNPTTDAYDFSVLLKVKCDTGFQGCRDVVVNDSDTSGEYEGRYRALSDSSMCFGKYSYKHMSKNYFLYAKLNSWYIGVKNCDLEEPFGDLVKFPDDALYPEDIQTSGTVPSGDLWTLADVSVTCYTPTSNSDLLHASMTSIAMCLLSSIAYLQY